MNVIHLDIKLEIFSRKRHSGWCAMRKDSNTASIVLMMLPADIGILSKELTKDLSSRMPHDLCQGQPFLEAVSTCVQNYGPDLNCYLIFMLASLEALPTTNKDWSSCLCNTIVCTSLNSYFQNCVTVWMVSGGIWGEWLSGCESAEHLLI